MACSIWTANYILTLKMPRPVVYPHWEVLYLPWTWVTTRDPDAKMFYLLCIKRVIHSLLNHEIVSLILFSEACNSLCLILAISISAGVVFVVLVVVVSVIACRRCSRKSQTLHEPDSSTIHTTVVTVGEPSPPSASDSGYSEIPIATRNKQPSISSSEEPDYLHLPDSTISLAYLWRSRYFQFQSLAARPLFFLHSSYFCHEAVRPFINGVRWRQWSEHNISWSYCGTTFV